VRLSEAIRLGAMLRPQGYDGLRQGGKSCALGAALDACGIAEHDDPDFDYHRLRQLFPLLNREAHCPACSRPTGWWRRWRGKEYDVEDVVVHLNDDHEWKRERIAEWVVTQEGTVFAADPTLSEHSVTSRA
jgi:hypothetical protein